MTTDVMLIARRFAAIGGITCIAAMMWACGARVVAQGVPASPAVPDVNHGRGNMDAHDSTP